MSGIQVTLAGRIGRNASVKAFDEGAVINFSLAIDTERVKRENGQTVYKRGVTWVNVQVSGYKNIETATKVAKYLGKGAIVSCHGQMISSEEGYPRMFKRQDGSVGASFDVRVGAGGMTLLQGKDVTSPAEEPAGELPPESTDF